MSRPRAAALTLAALALLAHDARAADVAPESIGVLPTGCGANLREVRELADRLSTELAPVVVQRRSSAPVLVVATSCTRVEGLTWQDGELTRTRAVSLADVSPSLRPVALAVLAAEFVRSVWATLRSDQAVSDAKAESAESAEGAAAGGPATAAPAGSATAKETAPPAGAPRTGAPAQSPAEDRPASKQSPTSESRMRIGADGRVRYFTKRDALFGGVDLLFDASFLFIAGTVLLGRGHDVIGNVSPGIAALSVGTRIPLMRSERVIWTAPIAVDVGYTWASASGFGPNVAATSAGTAYLQLAGGFALEAVVSRVFAIIVDVRCGAARGLGVTADGREVTGTQGFLMESGAGVRYVP